MKESNLLNRFGKAGAIEWYTRQIQWQKNLLKMTRAASQANYNMMIRGVTSPGIEKGILAGTYAYRDYLNRKICKRTCKLERYTRFLNQLQDGESEH